MVRIGLCGTMSVGKTTLVNELKKLDEFKDYKFFTERSKELSKIGAPLNRESTLKGQTIFMLERISELGEENMFADRTLIDVLSFTLASPNITIGYKDTFRALTKSMVKDYDLIIYIPPIVEMEDNGVRETNLEFREIIDNQILKIIDDFGLNNIHKLQNVGIEDRVKEIVKVIKDVKDK